MELYLQALRTFLHSVPRGVLLTRTCAVLAAIWVMGYALRRMHACRPGYGPVLLWAFTLLALVLLGFTQYLFPHRSLVRYLVLCTGSLAAISVAVWGVGWIVPFLLREDAREKAERRARRAARDADTEEHNRRGTAG